MGRGRAASLCFFKTAQGRAAPVTKNRGRAVYWWVLECPTTHNRPGCNPEGGWCARRVLEAERDFQDQKGRLQEEVEALGHRVLFYPKFHCKLNFIERYWCRAKWFARENCGYDFEALKTTVPEALASVTNASIRGSYRLAVRTIDACSAGLCYGTEEFKHMY